MSEIKLIVGLGNPGSKYEQTRHNVGFEAIDRLAKRWQIPLQESKRFKGVFGEGALPGAGKVRVLKPTTYMNVSGEAVRPACDWFKFEPESVLVVYDDMDLDVGRLRLRPSGSAGGHNGMKSIISHLGTQAFPRLRIGIGKGGPKKETISHVLGKFSPEEKPAIAEVLELGVDAMEVCLKQGVEAAMNLYNNRAIALKSSE